jgi:hypothetical protein
MQQKLGSRMRHSHRHLSARARVAKNMHWKLRAALGIVFRGSGTDEKETVPTIETIVTGFGTFQEELLQLRLLCLS